jgi:hypothetical protein
VSEDRSVVILPGGDLQGGGGVSLAALVPGDDLNLAGVDVAALGDVEVPHAVVDQLVFAALLTYLKKILIGCFKIRKKEQFFNQSKKVL